MGAAMNDRDVYIVSYARTPIGNFQGSLSSLSACELGAIAIKEAVSRAGLTDRMNLIDEVLMGNVLSAGLGQAPATSAMRLAGLPSSIPSTTVNKVCSSGMKAIMMAASSIKAGQADIVLAGGMESMSKAPFLLPNARGGMRFGDQMLVDGLKLDGLTDTATGWVMGKCGEKCAEDYGIGRAASDEYAKGSYEKAIAAAAQHSNEIVPVLVQGKEPIIVSSDEPPKNYNPQKMAQLKSIFKENGTVTAANASPMNDGAAALVLCSGSAVSRFGLTPMVKIIGYADASQDGIHFTTSPSLAIPKALKMAGKSIDEIDCYEINEAFSAVALANMKILNIPADKVNIWGGAVALGHPLGARITGTLSQILKHKNAHYGVAAVCNGGGGASAIIMERIQ